MHAELGVPGASEGQQLCRLAVRSTSPLVNRAVGQVELRAGAVGPISIRICSIFFIQSYGSPKICGICMNMCKYPIKP